ncbi:hypothetical protein JCM18903_2938 [Psychrobacter sp. JCM 18903]|jgi:hypothetical protein|uniref:hypothetical protein n=1 Tax=Psychrobacter TaxID=497 RepID=UPI0004322F35|nr:MULTISPECIES: hypothetical protein [Psychrobacter]GAF62831.1 hypothetical protein JCM18903_2938 [Psychrobacter sp. JCM 18903]
MNINLSRLNSCTWFSKQTKALASQLVFSLQIQQGVQLASLLGVDAILYNDEAIYVWVQRQIDDGLIVNDYTLSTLETAFIDLVTAHTDQAA